MNCELCKAKDSTHNIYLPKENKTIHLCDGCWVKFIETCIYLER